MRVINTCLRAILSTFNVQSNLFISIPEWYTGLNKLIHFFNTEKELVFFIIKDILLYRDI